jgi:hypothetical protein
MKIQLKKSDSMNLKLYLSLPLILLLFLNLLLLHLTRVEDLFRIAVLLFLLSDYATQSRMKI